MNDEKLEGLARLLRGFRLDVDPDQPRRDLYEAARAFYAAEQGGDAFVSPRRFLAWLRHHASNYEQVLNRLRAHGATEEQVQQARLWMNCVILRRMNLEIDADYAVSGIPRRYDRMRLLELELALRDELSLV